MINRLFEPILSHSFFLFGARGTGKSTWLKKNINKKDSLYIDLLDPTEEDIFNRNPKELEARVLKLNDKNSYVIIDEVQKAPQLLNLVHKLIEDHKIKFALTGSSARKLKRGSSNLLAGRAFVYNLFPLTYFELGDKFILNDVLRWGALPEVFHFKSNIEKKTYLRSYALTYLKEEVVVEQLVRNLNPFRNFLEIAAQGNSEQINFTNIARDVGVDVTTVQSYYSILEDTLIGFFLPAYHRSIRKRQLQSPKFYFFDIGAKNALAHLLDQALYPQTYRYGKEFEHFIICEVYRMNNYQQRDWQLSYFKTKDGGEIDLIIDRTGEATLLIEIKSKDYITEKDVSYLNFVVSDFGKAKVLCISCDPHQKQIGNVTCLHWADAIKEIFKKR